MTKRLFLVPFFFALIVIGLGISGVGTVIPAISRSFALPYPVVGQIFLFQGIGYFLSLFVGGFLGNVASQSLILRVGFILATLGFLGIAVSPSFFLVVIAFLLMGVGVGFVDCMVNPVATAIFRDRPGETLNFIHAFFGLGSMVSPRFYTLFSSGRYDWRDLYGVITVFTAVSLILFLLPFIPRKVHTTSSFRGLFPVFRKRAFWLMGFTMFFYAGGVATLNGWLVSYLVERNLVVERGALILSYFWLGLFVGRIALASISDRLGHLRLIRFGSLSGVAMVLLALFMPTGSFWSSFFFFASGFGLSVIIPTTLAYAVTSFPDMASLVSGWVLFNNGFGTLLFPWLGGIVGGRLGLGVVLFAVPFFLFMMFLCQQLLVNTAQREKRNG
ncbi:MAG: MFS transporter [Atribacterota bacterium]